MRLLVAAVYLLAAFGLSCAQACIKLTACSTKVLQQGSTGSCVRALQPLVGTRNDDIFGPKTKAAVVAYQKSRGLVASGIVGPSTWRALLANCRTSRLVKAPTQFANFKASKKCAGLTSPKRPEVRDALAKSVGDYGSKGAGISAPIGREWKKAANAQVAKYKNIYPNAAAALARFLSQSGNDRTFDAGKLVSQSTRANDCMVKDLNLLRDAAEALVIPGQTKCLTNTIEEAPRSATAPVCNPKRKGTINIVMSKVPKGDFDWHAAVGGYRTATQATVTNKGGVFTATIAYSVRDFYKWDPLDVSYVGLVVPNQMNQLHTWGMARDFEQSGTVRLVQTWRAGERLAYKK